MKQVKKRIRKIVEAIGYEVYATPREGKITIRRKCPLGRDHLKDCKRILGKDNIRIILDVGANVGQTSISFLEHFPMAMIYSFEPDSRNYKSLVDNIRDNSRIKPVNIALGDTNETATLHRNEFGQTNSLMECSADVSKYMDAWMLKSVDSQPVKVLTIDTFCAEHGIVSIDLLKIDAQGYDLKVLEGARGLLGKCSINMIYVEVIFVPVYLGQPSFAQISEFLDSYGFRLVGLYEMGYGNSYFLVGGNALFVRDYHAKS